jgi:DNA-binding response OmpR family regulator
MGSRQRLAPHDPVAPGTRVLAVGCGDPRTGVLEVAGYDVSRRPCVEFAQVAKADLLILALMPPEPPTAALVRVLRERSDVRVLAIVQGLGATERTAIIEAGAEECLDTSEGDAEFLARTRTLLREQVERVLVDQLG